MDNDTKLIMFMETLGPDCDVDVARSVLESMDWDLEGAIVTMTGSASSSPPPAQSPPADEYRAPMQTGYTDTLMGPRVPLNPAEALRQELERKEIERQRQEELERKQAAAEKLRRESIEEQVMQQRVLAEKEAIERRKRKIKEEQARAQLEADPVAMQKETERRKAEADEAAERKRQEEERRQREEAKAETDKRKREQDADLQAKRRADKEKEDLQREKEDAESRAAAPPLKAVKEKPCDAFAQALGTLRRNYKDIDPAGLVTCLQTLHKYIDNLVRNPSEPKFQRINCENVAFCNRVAAFNGAVEVLKALGFEDGDAGHLVVGPDFAKTKGSSLWDALTKFEVIIGQAKAMVDSA